MCQYPVRRTLRSSFVCSSALLQLIMFLLFMITTTRSAIPPCKPAGMNLPVYKPGCDIVSVRVNGCSGYCPSLSYYNPILGKVVRHLHKCCTMKESEDVPIELNCSEGKQNFTIPSAKRCECDECPTILRNMQ